MKNKYNEIKKANVLMIFFEANTFKKEFNRKVTEFRSKEFHRSVHDEYPIPYCITLAAFACELFIKFLIGVREIKNDQNAEMIRIPKGHNLNFLYSKLPIEYQESILKKIDEQKLKEIVARNADSFMEWRYIYEAKEDSVIFTYDHIKQLIDVSYEISDKEKNNTFFDADKATDVVMEGTEELDAKALISY